MKSTIINVSEWRVILNTIFIQCHSTVSKIIVTLKQTKNVCNDLRAKEYYDDVFSRIYINLTNKMKTLIGYNNDSNLSILS